MCLIVSEEIRSTLKYGSDFDWLAFFFIIVENDYEQF